MLRWLIRFAARVRVFLEFNSWGIKCMTRMQQGRLYVFRDAPLWFVQIMAVTPPANDTDLARKFHTEAVAELDRRILTAARTGEPIREEI